MFSLESVLKPAICPAARDFLPGEANLTQIYWMYCKENWQCMAGKDPLLGMLSVFKQILGYTALFRQYIKFRCPGQESRHAFKRSLRF